MLLTPPTVRMDAASWAMAGVATNVKSIKHIIARSIAEIFFIFFLFLFIRMLFSNERGLIPHFP
jgi:hypothetical protein